MDRRSLLRGAVTAGAGLVLVQSTTAAAGAPAGRKTAKKPPSGPRDISYRQWTTDAEFATGTAAGVAATGGAVVFAGPIGQFTYADPFLGTTATYDYATWTSPEVPVGFAATEAVASWTADTPGGSWIAVDLRGITAAGNQTAWYAMGRWAADDGQIARTSVGAQTDADGSIAIDTFIAAAGHGLTRVQLRVTLYRPVGTTTVPAVRSLGVMTSNVPATATATTPQTAQGITLNVPRYSQEIHAGQYPQWNGGGEAWCSPTSTSMVVAYWGTGPTPADYAWVDPSFADPWVDYAARQTYDSHYDGTGNWPFNTAYAGRFGLDGFVTRLRSLNEAEAFIAAGVPLVHSLSFKKNEIPGLTYSTGGHLLVLVGFTASGEPVLNDPASPSNTAVRKTVGRPEFEAAWLNTSGGLVYVIHPTGHPLPTRPAQPNW